MSAGSIWRLAVSETVLFLVLNHSKPPNSSLAVNATCELSFTFRGPGKRWQMSKLKSVILGILPLLAIGDITLVVRSDGTGNFSSVQAALDSCAPGSNPDLGRVTLLLRGHFFEAVEVYSNFTGGVSFVGTGAEPLDALIIDNRPGTVYSWLSATVKVDCNGVCKETLSWASRTRASTPLPL